MCGPVCAIGIASGLGISRWLGIDDLTLGLWIGALILSISVQFDVFLRKKGKNFPYSFWVILIGTYLLSFLPIMKSIIGDPTCYFLGMPKVIGGSLIGMLVLFLADKLNLWTIARHNHKVYFYYQKAIIPLVVLLIASFIIEAIC